MKIVATRPVSLGSGHGLGPGEMAEVTEDVGHLLIAMGKAARVVPVAVSAPPVIERAVVAPQSGSNRAPAPKSGKKPK